MSDRSDSPRGSALLETINENQRVVLTLRAVLALLLAVCAATFFRLEAGVFTLAPTLIILFFFRDKSYEAGFMLLGGTILGAVVEALVITLFFSATFVFLAVNALLILANAYWIGQAMRGRWFYPFAAVFALITLASTMYAGMNSAEAGLQAALNWTLETTIGVSCTWIVTKFVWPFPSVSALMSTIRGIERACASLLRTTADRYAAGKPPIYLPSSLSLIYFKSQLALIHTQKKRLSASDPSYDELKWRLERLRAIYVHIRLAARSLDARRCQALALPQRQPIVDLMYELSRHLEAGALESEDAEQHVAAIPDHLAVLKSNMEAIVGYLRTLNLDQAQSARIYHPELPSAEEPQPAHRFGLQTDSLQHAVKLTLALGIGFSLHLLPNFPASAYLVIGMIVVLIQPNTGRSQLRVRLWMVGVLSGSAYSLIGLGIVAVLPHFTLLLLLMALGYLIGGYFAAGPDTTSYGGLQFCVALSIILGLSALPLETVHSAEARFIGAVLSFFIALVIALNVWPAHPVRQLRNGVAGSLRKAAGHLEGLRQDTISSGDTLAWLKDFLYADTIANLELLHDASFIPERQRGGVDFENTTRVATRLFAQLFTLHEMLRQHADAEQRADILGPILANRDRMVESLFDVADVIEKGTFERLPEIRSRLYALQAALPHDSDIWAGIDQQSDASLRAKYFGIQAVHDIVADLVLITNDLMAESGVTSQQPEPAVSALEGA